ncbi:FecR family protein [Spirosoma telluris]|uniref:FecR family protein n=1 Tax=Spirosoma telluris TaxID=2183553 RepID=UPI002FC2A421
MVWAGAYQANSSLTYQTAYGKIQEIKLADGSVVTLNANSVLKVADNMADRPVREVWLEGEAYFDIAKRKGAKFIVHTAEAQIEVLGTEFNVNTRRDETHIVLEEGKVQLSTDNQSMVVMKPGDMATVSPKSRQIQLKRVQPDLYDAWKASYIVLDGKSLPEIINSLEDTFGVTIKLEDAQLVDKKLTGKLSTEVAEDCIDNLSIILDADVKKVGDTYVFD